MKMSRKVMIAVVGGGLVITNIPQEAKADFGASAIIALVAAASPFIIAGVKKIGTSISEWWQERKEKKALEGSVSGVNRRTSRFQNQFDDEEFVVVYPFSPNSPYSKRFSTSYQDDGYEYPMYTRGGYAREAYYDDYGGYEWYPTSPMRRMRMSQMEVPVEA